MIAEAMQSRQKAKPASAPIRGSSGFLAAAAGAGAVCCAAGGVAGRSGSTLDAGGRPPLAAGFSVVDDNTLVRKSADIASRIRFMCFLRGELSVFHAAVPPSRPRRD
jgi:hypothetical protein